MTPARKGKCRANGAESTPQERGRFRAVLAEPGGGIRHGKAGVCERVKLGFWGVWWGWLAERAVTRQAVPIGEASGWGGYYRVGEDSADGEPAVVGGLDYVFRRDSRIFI